LWELLAKTKPINQNEKWNVYLQELISGTGKSLETKAKPKPMDQDEKWNVHLQELIKYKREFGNVDVPNKFPSLGSCVQWQQMQYKLHKAEKSSQMAEEWSKVLNGMGFNFKSKTVQDNETVVKPNSANITYLTGSKL